MRWYLVGAEAPQTGERDFNPCWIWALYGGAILVSIHNMIIPDEVVRDMNTNE